jgi:S1-C subfamily serine protease
MGDAMSEDYELRHKRVALPCVRIRAGKAGGSGTVIYSAANEDGEYSTYILTNHHVVDGCITIDDKWSTLLKSKRKMDVFETVDVHIFDYKWESRAIGGTTVQSDIVTYDKEEDLALIHLRSPRAVPAVAKLYPQHREIDLRVGMPVICVGAGLGENPVQTEGALSQFGREIDRREFWLFSAAGIFGNSGGALFLKDTYELIGVPARIAVAMVGFSVDPITHLMYCIPITRIYDFLDAQKFRFIYDDDFTEEGEAELRRELREAEEKKAAMASMAG